MSTLVPVAFELPRSFMRCFLSFGLLCHATLRLQAADELATRCMFIDNLHEQLHKLRAGRGGVGLGGGEGGERA